MFMEPQYARACDVLIGGGSRFVERISFWKFAGDEEGRGVGDAALTISQEFDRPQFCFAKDRRIFAQPRSSRTLKNTWVLACCPSTKLLTVLRRAN